MRAPLLAALAALASALALAPNGSGEAPPQVSTAIAEQRNLVAARPGEAGVWNDLGNLLALSGNLDEAETAYGRALEIDAGSVQARFNLALLRQQRGDLDAAIVEYRELLGLDPEHAWAHYQLGAAYEVQGERELALGHYAEAFTLDPELLFAETNPHIIENGLVTEALLLARRSSRSRPPAPRAYDEPGRINSILEPGAPVPPQGAEPETEDEAEATATEDEARGAHVARDQFARGPRPDSRAGQAATDGKDRVLDSSDLRGSVRNQVNGEAEGGAPMAPGSRRRAGATVTSERRRGVSQPPMPDPAQAFGFGQRSTGSLDWKLGPASDQPVPAR